MSYHIVSIDSPQCSLSCRNGQLTCKTEEGQKSLPLEDVASIIITSFSANIHSHLLLEAAKSGVSLILCETFKPVSLVLPANRSTDTLLTRAVISIPQKLKDKFWTLTVDAKCQNQFMLAAYLAPHDERLPLLKSIAFGRKRHKEAHAAKLFWQIYGAVLGEEEFTRGRKMGGMNNLLNYGYAVLLSTVLQKLFGVGLDPTFGISHVVRERSAPLAYDLMEPFRPCVDWRIVQWLKQKKFSEDAFEVSPEFRKWVTSFPIVKVDYMNFNLEIRGCIEGVVRSFRRAVLEKQFRFYKPWIPKNSKWAG
ncbi:MAG: type II CRISPR-associated endonuclease Cas1 [Verrucomicrobiota bacterium]